MGTLTRFSDGGASRFAVAPVLVWGGAGHALPATALEVAVDGAAAAKYDLGWGPAVGDASDLVDAGGRAEASFGCGLTAEAKAEEEADTGIGLVEAAREYERLTPGGAGATDSSATDDGFAA